MTFLQNFISSLELYFSQNNLEKRIWIQKWGVCSLYLVKITILSNNTFDKIVEKPIIHFMSLPVVFYLKNNNKDRIAKDFIHIIKMTNCSFQTKTPKFRYFLNCSIRFYKKNLRKKSF